MPTYQHILMGDVTGSAAQPKRAVARDLQTMTEEANVAFKNQVKSPLTVTLGDEFQGIVADASTVLDVILHFEAMHLTGKAPRLHYSWVFGEVDTDINPRMAHGMLGPGLTEARKMLSNKSRARRKVHVKLAGMDDTAAILENSFVGLFGYTGRWKPKDFALASDLLQHDDIADIAERHDRTASSIYRRRDSFMIDEVQSLTQALRLLCKAIDSGQLNA